MSLSSNVAALATRVATEFKALTNRYPTVVKASGSTYAARPTGAVQVIWVGTADPGAAALDGDMWVQI